MCNLVKSHPQDAQVSEHMKNPIFVIVAAIPYLQEVETCVYKSILLLII